MKSKITSMVHSGRAELATTSRESERSLSSSTLVYKTGADVDLRASDAFENILEPFAMWGRFPIRF